MTKIIKYAILILLLAAAAAVLYFSLRPKEDSVTVSKAEIADIRTFASLCSMDFYSEIPIVDTIHNRVLVGIQKQRGSIMFDLDGLEFDADADTIRFRLPKERIELYEAADPNSWQVVDTKYIGPMPLLHSDKMSLEDENLLKSRIMRKSKEALYKDGTVKRARRHAAHTLADLLSRLYSKPVIITHS